MIKTKKIISIFLILVVLCANTISVSALSKPFYISFVAATRIDSTTVSFFYYCPPNTEGNTSIMVLNSQKSTDPKDILFLSEMYFYGNGYGVLYINFPSGCLDESENYYIVSGKGMSGKTSLGFSGKKSKSVSKTIAIEPGTYSDILYKGLYKNSTYLLTVNDEEFNPEEYDKMLTCHNKYYVKSIYDDEFNFELIVKGDINDDNIANTQDALITLRICSGKLTIPDEKIELVDMDFSGNISSADALKILQFSVNKASIF